MKINEVSTIYKVSKRTLRYYEEIGLLTSSREENSNGRIYDVFNISRLEQILLLKRVGFSLNEIQEVLGCNSSEFIQDKLIERLNEVQIQVRQLDELKGLLIDLIKISQSEGTQNINFYELLKQQVYMRQGLERMDGMVRYTKEIIRIEFGEAVIEVAQELVSRITLLKKDIHTKLSKEIPLIRIRDDINLHKNQYRIMIKDMVIVSDTLQDEQDRVDTMIKSLESAILNNIDLL